MIRFPIQAKLFVAAILVLLTCGGRRSSLLAQGDSQGNESGASGGISLTAKAGFDGYYKPEAWAPVHILVANQGPGLEAELRVTTGSAAAGDRVIYNSLLSLPTQSQKQVTLFVYFSSFASDLTVELFNDEGQLVSSSRTNPITQMTADDLLYGTVSSNPGEFSYLGAVSGERARAKVASLDITQLPEATAAWNSLDILVMDDIDTGQMTAGQLEGLRGWLNTGGQLVVTGGPGWQKTAAAFTDLLPVQITGSETIDDLPALSQFAGLPFRDAGPYLVATSSLRQGELLIHQDGLPLLARHDVGQGSVFFLALDPKLAPLADWDGREAVWAEITRSVPFRPLWERGFHNGYAASSAVTSLPSLALPSTAQLMLFLLIYVTAVGPANYLVLKRLNRRELAWVTVPILIIFFSGLAYATGFQLKGNDIILNQMSVAFGRAGNEQVRVQSLLGLYSPRRATYDLILPGDVMARPFERNYGSMIGSGNLDAVTRGRNLTLAGIRVDVSDTETFIADSYQPAPPISAQASLHISGNALELAVNIQNDSDMTMGNATILLGSTAISLGDIPPGGTLSQSDKIGGTGGGSIVTPGAPVFVPPPGAGGTTLISNADTLLGTSDYYNDPETFPRWQMLSALDGEPFLASSTASVQRSDIATLVFWSDQPQLEARLDKESYTVLGTTLYLLELPLSQTLAGGSEMTLPVALLNWEVLASSIPYEVSIHDLFLQGGWAELEYTPWAEFQTMSVKRLEIVLTPQDTPPASPPPEIRLWDWKKGDWITLEGSDWGVTPVPNFERFVGPGNAVRIRLQNSSDYGAGISEVYPALAGDLD
ncbi:MAG: hypothetical protein ACE5E7_18110 [Anaerolineae bacterium]